MQEPAVSFALKYVKQIAIVQISIVPIGIEDNVG
jgi:hypothetical protein